MGIEVVHDDFLRAFNFHEHSHFVLLAHLAIWLVLLTSNEMGILWKSFEALSLPEAVDARRRQALGDYHSMNIKRRIHYNKAYLSQTEQQGAVVSVPLDL